MIHSRPSRHISKNGAFGALHGLKRVGQRRGIPPEDWDWPPRLGPVLETLLGVRWPEPGSFKSAALGRHDQWGQNDAVILDLDLEGDTFSLTVNHYDVERLAAVMVDYQEWRSLRKAFPVEFTVAGVTEFHALTAVEDSAILKLRHRLRTLGNVLCDIRCIFEVPSFGDTCSFVFAIHEFFGEFKRKGHTPKLCDYGTYLCVSGKSLVIHESYREGWAGQFGAEALFILDRFDPLWPKNNWAVPDFERWFDEEFSAEEKERIENIRNGWINARK